MKTSPEPRIAAVRIHAPRSWVPIRVLAPRGSAVFMVIDLCPTERIESKVMTSIRSHCLAPGRPHHPHRPARAVDAPLSPQRYARMFPNVPSFTAEQEFLYALGREGGLCDCGDLTDNPGSDAEVAAGWPIFGQFVAHDITADRSAPGPHEDVQQLRNARSPQLNLECL